MQRNAEFDAPSQRTLVRLALMGVVTATLCSACMYSSYTKPVAKPIERKLQTPYSWSQISTGGTASIGDRLFWVRRYVNSAKEQIAARAPLQLQPFPSEGRWLKTHTYDNDDGHDLSVYTSSDYYHGTIGVIVDNDDNLATKLPAVQVAGAKEGRRWKMATGSKFFVVPDTLIEAWGVRYGGRRGANYVFEIVDSPNPSASQITQSLEISSSEFFAGFTVRGIFIKGLEDLGSGLIRYSLRDNRVDK